MFEKPKVESKEQEQKVTPEELLEEEVKKPGFIKKVARSKYGKTLMGLVGLGVALKAGQEIWKHQQDEDPEKIAKMAQEMQKQAIVQVQEEMPKDRGFVLEPLEWTEPGPKPPPEKDTYDAGVEKPELTQPRDTGFDVLEGGEYKATTEHVPEKDTSQEKPVPEINPGLKLPTE